MSREGSGAKVRSVGVLIVGFYVVLAVAVFFGVRYVPVLEDLVLLSDTPAEPAIESGIPDDAVTSTVQTMEDATRAQGLTPTGWDTVWVTAASLLGAIIIMIPVAWSYILIKRDAGYEESVVHTLLILPVAVTGIVMIVKGDLALGFALAGIVAAVRFRTTLDDTKDAVYVFLAIGVGLAAGVQALGVAIALSVVFNVVNLTLWKLNFGNVYADRLHRTGGLGLGTVIAGPASGRSAVGYGNRALEERLAPSTIDQVRAQQARIRAQLRSESPKRKERKQYSALLVYTRDPDTAREMIPAILEPFAERFRLADSVASSDKDVHALTWLVRLEEGVSGSHVVAGLKDSDEDGVIVGAEIRSLREIASDR